MSGKPDYEDLLEEARERFTHVKSNDKSNRDNQKKDTEFVYVPGKQWPDDIRDQRTGWKEPCLEFNQLKQFVNQVVNDQRQNRPGIRVHPANGEASDEVAEILQGLIRGIEYDSKAEAAYDNAYQGAVVGGRGYWRVVSEYEGPKSFNQKLIIKPIADPNTVYADIDYQEPDGSDRNYCFVAESIPDDEFKRQWPDAEPVSWGDIDSSWKDGEEKIIVADYYRRVCNKRTLVMMSDGAVGWKDEMPTPPQGITVKAEREAEVYTVEWYKIAGGNQVLEKYEWPGTIIPVVCTTGDDIMVDGQRIFQGLIRQARDPQTMFNFGMTQQAVHLALTPKAPWVVAEGQIEGYENIWKDANTKNYSVLPYKPTAVDGTLVPSPQRTAPSIPDAGWINWCQSMGGLIKSTIGMYENSLGMKGQEQSGRAIRAREQQGDTATFHYVDNLSRAIALTGRIIIEVIPPYYDTQRIVHIIGPDDVRKEVTINQASPDPSNPLEAIKNNDVTSGEYSVTVAAGPGYQTKRQETADLLAQLVQAYPQIMQVAGDLVVKAQDIADSDVIAERLKYLLPPAVQQAEAAKQQSGKAPDPATVAKLQQLSQQGQEMQQVIQQLSQENQQLKSGAQEKMQAAQIDGQVKLQQSEMEAQLKEREAQLRAAADERTAQEQAARDIAKARMDMDLAIQKAQLEAETELKKAMIARETALEVAQINAGVKYQIASTAPVLGEEKQEPQ